MLDLAKDSYNFCVPTTRDQKMPYLSYSRYLSTYDQRYRSINPFPVFKISISKALVLCSAFGCKKLAFLGSYLKKEEKYDYYMNYLYIFGD